MPAPRRRNLLRGRRRVEDDGEDDDGILGAGEDSASEASALTDAEDGSESEESDLSDNDDGEAPAPINTETRKGNVLNVSETSAAKDIANISANPLIPTETSATPAFQPTADTLVMLNGFKSENDTGGQEVVDFDEEMIQSENIQTEAQQVQQAQAATTLVQPSRETMFQRRAREREEYKLKKESDPAFVPNRGGFFMHDSRNDNFAQLRPAASGRGRGRGGSSFPVPARLPFRLGNPSADASLSKWNHDLHDTVNKPVPVMEHTAIAAQHPATVTAGFRSEGTTQTSPLSKTTSVGTVMVRCAMPCSERPAKLLKMTVRQHTRLPDLRPPLRRDKPVRVALPDRGPRYIFPSIDKSFIFIPRAQRPNQQASRGRLRSVFSGSGSRRTSAYGGSVYEPSISMSRRSSLAPDMVPRFMVGGQPSVAVVDTGRPVVRLPLNAHLYHPATNFAVATTSTEHLSTSEMAMNAGLPTDIAAQIPMHQPRPQKTVSVATIESPDRAPLHAPQQQEQQPFYHQVPAHMTEQILVDRQETLAAAQSSTSNPSNIDQLAGNGIETAINAEPFQPARMRQPSLYNTSYTTSQPMYYYNMPPNGQAEHFATENMTSPAYVQQGAYLVPTYMPQVVAPDEAATMAQVGMYAQERNGMVYYYDSNQVGSSTDTGYTVPGGGGILTPGPENYYYAQGAPGMVYYSTQQ